MKEPKQKIWSDKVDNACVKYFLQGDKDETLFNEVIYPSLQWVARWQIRDSLHTRFTGMDNEELEQELICYILIKLPHYDTTKGMTWFSYCRKWMGFRITHISQKNQAKQRDTKKTCFINDLGDNALDFFTTGSQQNNHIMEDKEFMFLSVGWWKEHLYDYFYEKGKAGQTASKVIKMWEGILNNKDTEYFKEYLEDRTAFTGSLSRMAEVNKRLKRHYEEHGTLPV